jgi:hypothetical protein
MDRIVKWVNTAWIDIQEMRLWNFIWKQDSFTVSTNNRILDPVGAWQWKVHEWDYESFSLYRSDLGVTDEMFLQFMVWDDFKLSYDIGTVTQQRPQIITRRPDEKLVLNFTADNDYIFSANYYALPVPLINNTDTPGMPERFHLIIVWRACEYYAEFEEAGVLKAEMRKRFNRMLSKMEESQLPIVRTARPMV